MVVTGRLRLDVPTSADLPELHAIYSDPLVWQHFPSLRHADPATTEAMLQGWISGWERDGLGVWIVRTGRDDAVIGNAGCGIREGCFWNLGYRFAPTAQGQGYATEVSLAGVAAARETAPELPVVAFLLEHNLASKRVAEKVGLTLMHRAPDAGNPDPTEIRLIYADRCLEPEVLAATLR